MDVNYYCSHLIGMFTIKVLIYGPYFLWILINDGWLMISAMFFTNQPSKVKIHWGSLGNIRINGILVTSTGCDGQVIKKTFSATHSTVVRW